MTTFKAIATRTDVKASAVYALKSGVSVKSVKNQLREHGMNVDGLFTRSQLIIHLNKE